jgi:hypothetical protein
VIGAVKALALVAVAGASALALQGLLLPRASRSQLTAVHVETWLIQHRVVRASRVDRASRRVGTTCAGGWPRQGLVKGRARASFLIVGDRHRLVGIRGDVFRPGSALREDDRVRSIASFELAGCPWWLARELGNILDERLPLQVAPAVVEGRLAYRLVLGWRRRVVLYVSRRTYAPLAIRVAGPQGGWARLRPGTETDEIAVDKLFAPFAKVRRPTV